jgi:hypothetical protein
MDLGIRPPNARLTAADCASAGFWRVNGPVSVIICAVVGLAIGLGCFAAQPDLGPNLSTVTGIAAMIAGVGAIPAGWLWWSYSVPRWRIWALRTVDNWPELEALAIKQGLIWPRGSSFEQTEFKTPEMRALEQALLQERDKEYSPDRQLGQRRSRRAPNKT